jgi:hypothetical protein
VTFRQRHLPNDDLDLLLRMADDVWMDDCTDSAELRSGMLWAKVEVFVISVPVGDEDIYQRRMFTKAILYGIPVHRNRLPA